MCWSDVTLEKDDSGVEFLSFCERQTKTRTGENTRDVRVVIPKLFENTLDPTKCPVKIYKFFAAKRPVDFCRSGDPFYIATTTVKSPSPRQMWYKKSPVGINKLSSMMKRMVENAGLNPGKKLSNHSARKYLIQKLCDHNIPAHQIMQISGHKNIQSINQYSHINTDQHKAISDVLYSAPEREPLALLPSFTESRSSSNSMAVTASTSKMNTELSVTGGIQNIFGGAIHGGNFTVNIAQGNGNTRANNPCKRRWNVIDSDSSQD